jgi:hypothetical protein
MLIILVTRLCISLALDSTVSYLDICFVFADELVDVVELVDFVELVELDSFDESLLLNNLLLRLLLADLKFLARTREFLALLILICTHLPLIIYINYIG